MPDRESLHVITASNIATIAIALGVIWVYLPLAWRQFREGNKGDATLLMLGISFVAMGTILHRSFWSFYRFVADLDEKMAAATLNSSVVLLPIALVFVWVGYSLHIYTKARTMFHHPRLAMASAAIVIWLAAYFTSKMFP